MATGKVKLWNAPSSLLNLVEPRILTKVLVETPGPLGFAVESLGSGPRRPGRRVLGLPGSFLRPDVLGADTEFLLAHVLGPVGVLQLVDGGFC